METITMGFIVNKLWMVLIAWIWYDKRQRDIKMTQYAARIGKLEIEMGTVLSLTEAIRDNNAKLDTMNETLTRVDKDVAVLAERTRQTGSGE